MPKYQREQEEFKKQLSALQEQSAEHDATEQNAGKWISLIHYRFIGNLTDSGNGKQFNKKSS